jgi:general secretion pathway protein G
MRKERVNMRTAYDGGYTLMELLVVLAILGFLAVIATPQVMQYLAGARVSTAKTEVANLSGALDLFKFDVGRYPSSEEGLAALLKAPPGVAAWNGPYVRRQTNLIDPWGKPFIYVFPGEHGEFDLLSYGADGEKCKPRYCELVSAATRLSSCWSCWQ